MERRRARIRPRAATTAVIGNNDDQPRPSEGRHPLRRFEPPAPSLRALVLATVVLCGIGQRPVDAFRPTQGCPGPERARSWPALALPDDARTWMTSSSRSRSSSPALVTPLAATRGGVDGLERHLAASLWEDEGEEEDDEEAPVEQLLNPRGAAQPPAAPRRRGRPRKAEVVLIEEGGKEEAEEAARTRRQAPQLPASASAGKGAALSSSSSSSATRFLPTVSRGSARRGLLDGALDAAIAQKAQVHVRPSNKHEERLMRLEAMLAAADEEEGGDDDDAAAGAEEGPAATAAARAHTVDLYVPPADLEVMLAWADRLMERRLEGRAQWSLPPGAATAASEEAEGEQGRGGRRGKQQRPGQGQRAGSKALVALSKEQRLLSLAQMFLGMEKLRAEMADAEPGPGAVTSRELAGRLGLRPSEVEAFYKLGLRARSYILMSMHGLILSLARRYAAAFGDAVDKAELVQEGYKGAMLAVERYDPVKGASIILFC